VFTHLTVYTTPLAISIKHGHSECPSVIHSDLTDPALPTSLTYLSQVHLAPELQGYWLTYLAPPGIIHSLILTSPAGHSGLSSAVHCHPNHHHQSRHTDVPSGPPWNPSPRAWQLLVSSPPIMLSYSLRQSSRTLLCLCPPVSCT
jgi:hypothetical protein